MPSRIGFRMYPAGGGTQTLAVILDGFDLQTLVNNETGTSHKFSESDISNAGGGTVGFITSGAINYGFGLSRSGVSSAFPWVIWFNAPEGVFNALTIGTILILQPSSAPSPVFLEVILETNGVPTILFSGVANSHTPNDNGTDDWTSGFNSLFFNPPLNFGGFYSNFWTGFNRTRENAPT